MNRIQRLLRKARAVGNARLRTILTNRRERIKYNQVRDFFNHAIREQMPSLLVLGMNRMKEEVKRKKPSKRECARIIQQARRFENHTMGRVARAAKELIAELN